jgi:hypothetical protein
MLGPPQDGEMMTTVSPFSISFGFINLIEKKNQY